MYVIRLTLRLLIALIMPCDFHGLVRPKRMRLYNAPVVATFSNVLSSCGSRGKASYLPTGLSQLHLSIWKGNVEWYKTSMNLGAVPKTNGSSAAAETRPIRTEASPIGSYGCVTEEDGLTSEQRL